MKDVFIVIVGLILLGVVWVTWEQFQATTLLPQGGTPVPTQRTPEGERPVACTADAKICPDGSGVGRVGPDCEFALCPGEIAP